MEAAGEGGRGITMLCTHTLQKQPGNSILGTEMHVWALCNKLPEICICTNSVNIHAVNNPPPPLPPIRVCARAKTQNLMQMMTQP